MKKLLKANYLIYNHDGKDWKRGEKLPLCLTSTTSEQMRLNSLVIQYKENNEDRHEKTLKSYRKLKGQYQQTIERQRAEIELRRRMIYYIIFRVMSIKTPNRHYKYPGVSVTDIINARYDGHAFYFLRLEEDRSTVEECIRNLQREDIVREIKIDAEQESRYTLIEPIWKGFVKDCSELLEDIIMLRLHVIWQNIRKPTPMERLYDEYCWGERTVNGRMNRVCETLEENRKNCIGKKHLEEQAKQLIESLDYNIVKDVIELRKKYHDLIERYTWTCNEIIKTVYPEFIQLEVERIEKNETTKHKKYPNLLRGFTSDVLEFRDSAKSAIAERDKIIKG